MKSASKEFNKINPEEKAIVLKYLLQAPIKLGAMAKELGLDVKKTPTLPRNVSGQIKKAGNTYQIKINRFESPQRQRFTLAHEISHYLMHRNIIDYMGGELKDNVLYRSGAPSEIEFEANRLAAQIIMPDELVKERYHALGGVPNEEILIQLAEEFKVSKVAMEVRLGIR